MRHNYDLNFILLLSQKIIKFYLQPFSAADFASISIPTTA